MMKKMAILAVGCAFLAGGVFSSLTAHAATSSLVVITSADVASDFVEFDGLTVTAVSAPGTPTQITVANPVSCVEYPSIAAIAGVTMQCPTPVASGYAVTMNAAVQILLGDLRAGTFSDIAPGDRINVYGWYVSGGTLQAYSLRDLSKTAGGPAAPITTVPGTISAPTPAETQLLQEMQALLSQMEMIVNQIGVLKTSAGTTL